MYKLPSCSHELFIHYFSSLSDPLLNKKLENTYGFYIITHFSESIKIFFSARDFGPIFSTREEIFTWIQVVNEKYNRRGK